MGVMLSTSWNLTQKSCISEAKKSFYHSFNSGPFIQTAVIVVLSITAQQAKLNEMALKTRPILTQQQ